MNGRSTAAFATLLVLSFVGAGATLHAVRAAQPKAALEDALYVTSPDAVKRMSLGYTGLMADIYWTRVVQYFGTKHHAYSREYNSLKPLLDITTTLDPHLLVAYEFGSTFLAQSPPEGAGDPNAAVALIEKGIAANPDEWRLYYEEGFIYYFEKKDYAHAGDVFLRGSKVPGAHPWLRVLAARMESDAGSIKMARYLWSRIYEESQDKEVRENAIHHLAALDVDETVPQLEHAVSIYHDRTGQWPSSWIQLNQARIIRGIPRDPIGNAYVLTEGGRVEVADYKKLPFITEGLPSGTQPLTYIPPSAPEPKTQPKTSNK